MSEYWKSTPKYWCKHCKTYVRDTKLEKQNHDATPKHQGNLKRFLRDLHRGHERDEREKQRAKDEVARLNGAPTGASGSSTMSQGPFERRLMNSTASSSKLPQATPAERKQQMTRLAEMGVAIPEEYRREMAMPGDWQTTSQRIVYDDVKKEDENADTKPNGLNVGVRKRTHEEQDDDEEAEVSTTRRGWGTTTLDYPTDGDDGLDALLNSTVTARNGANSFRTANVKEETDYKDLSNSPAAGVHQKSGLVQQNLPSIKKEESPDDFNRVPLVGQETPDLSIKQEDPEVLDVVFKKRRPKAIRQK